MINETDQGTHVQKPGSETKWDLLWEVEKVPGRSRACEEETVAADEAGESQAQTQRVVETSVGSLDKLKAIGSHRRM